MKIILSICCTIFITSFVFSQEIITGTYDFQTDPAKKYALFIPSEYDSNTPSKVIVGLHPWNTSKWDAESWAMELSELAEANNCIVICPDGGADGQIDDDIDTAFTSFLIDEMASLYNLDENNMYLLGFSWGGKTVYTYGLNHVNRFAGFMPIGAAVSENEVEDFVEAAQGRAFYIIHGSLDSPNSRYFPLLQLLENNFACVESNLLDGVGHTVEFDNQFNILNEGLQYLLDEPCALSNTTNFTEEVIEISSKSLRLGESLKIKTEEKVQWTIYNSVGQLVRSGTVQSIDITESTGQYHIVINNQAAISFVIL